MDEETHETPPAVTKLPAVMQLDLRTLAHVVTLKEHELEDRMDRLITSEVAALRAYAATQPSGATRDLCMRAIAGWAFATVLDLRVQFGTPLENASDETADAPPERAADDEEGWTKALAEVDRDTVNVATRERAVLQVRELDAQRTMVPYLPGQVRTAIETALESWANDTATYLLDVFAPDEDGGPGPG